MAQGMVSDDRFYCIKFEAALVPSPEYLCAEATKVAIFGNIRPIALEVWETFILCFSVVRITLSKYEAVAWGWQWKF